MIIEDCSMKYTCPVCYYDRLRHPPSCYTICPCCGTEFELDNDSFSHEELRQIWIDGGMKWWFRTQPISWNPILQLENGAV